MLRSARRVWNGTSKPTPMGDVNGYTYSEECDPKLPDDYFAAGARAEELHMMPCPDGSVAPTYGFGAPRLTMNPITTAAAYLASFCASPTATDGGVEPGPDAGPADGGAASMAYEAVAARFATQDLVVVSGVSPSVSVVRDEVWFITRQGVGGAGPMNTTLAVWLPKNATLKRMRCTTVPTCVLPEGCRPFG